MFLRDACDQPVSSAWIGSICSHVALEKWSWHPCSPVSPPSSGQCSCWSSSPPAPVHSRLCVTVLPTLHPPGHFWWPFAPPRSSVTLNWTEGKQSARSALCANLQLRCFSLGGRLAGSLHPTNIPTCSRDLLPPCLSTGNLLLEGAFFCSVTKSFTPEMDSALHFDFPANERESYPVEYYFSPLSLLAVTHFLPTL